MSHFDLLVRGGVAVLPWTVAECDVGVRHGRIVALGALSDATADTVLDARHLHVLPGLIDPHVHFRDSGVPGTGDPEVETMATGTRGAVLGGITCVLDMPNTTPPLTDVAALAAKRAMVARDALCDVGLYVGATRDNISDLATLETAPDVCAIKVFAGSSTGGLLIDDDLTLERVMRAGSRRIAYHSEDEARLRQRRALFRVGEPYSRHAEWRDERCALLGTQRIVSLARLTRRPAHILHVSTAEEFKWLAAHRTIATVEVLVNHLTQASDAYDRDGPLAVMNPPIRDARHRDAAWAAVADGRVDTVGSDHAPHPIAAKQRPWPDCAAGLTGVQTLLPLMLDHVARGRLSLARMVDLMAAGPAQVYALSELGRLVVGARANLTLVDLRARRMIEADWLASPCGWSPFVGTRVTGWPAATVVGGRIAMRDGALGSQSVGTNS